jgi:hypothetical protein
VAYQEQQSRGAFFRKLSYYLAGIAIGFVMLGFFSQLKKSHKERQKAQEAAAAAEAAKQPRLFPPAPGETQQATPAGPDANGVGTSETAPASAPK